MKRATTDTEFAKAAKEKEEKFGMYLSSLSKASAAIQTAEKSLNSNGSVKELVEGAADVLGPYLGETVR